jgi:hypothetical protein
MIPPSARWLRIERVKLHQKQGLAAIDSLGTTTPKPSDEAFSLTN